MVVAPTVVETVVEVCSAEAVVRRGSASRLRAVEGERPRRQACTYITLRSRQRRHDSCPEEADHPVQPLALWSSGRVGASGVGRQATARQGQLQLSSDLHVQQCRAAIFRDRQLRFGIDL